MTQYSISQNAAVSKTNAFIRSVYNWMAAGLGITGLTSYFISNNPTLLKMIFANSMIPIVLFIGLIILVGALSARINKIQASTATGLYALIAVVYGISLTPIFLVYTASSIATTFFVCSATFITASAYGMFTKKDLTGLGQFLMMGLIGMIIAIVINWFVGSTMIQTIISCVGVLIFTGLTAYDTQKLKNMAYSIPDNSTGAMLRKGAIMGALSLYLDFMGLFIYLLQFLGVSRD